MPYNLAAAIGFAVIFAEAAYVRNPGIAPAIAVGTFILTFLSLALPPMAFQYTNQDHASVVLSRLMNRGAVGSGLMLANGILAWLFIGHLTDPVIFGEIYLFSALAIFLFQGFGAVVTRHVMYLQQTDQYDSNQLVAIILTLTLLLFILSLYFLAFDLSRQPELHAYLRDLLVLTVTLLGYGRAVYLMAHH